MDSKTSSYLAALCLGLLVWLYLSVDSLHIDYNWHSFLVNSTSGAKSRPVDVLELGKIIGPPSEQYLNQTHATDRLFVLIQQMNYQNSLATAQIYSNARQLEQSGWPVANQSACARELGWIQRQLGAHEQYGQLKGRLGYDLTRLVDTFGKPGSGLFSGAASTWQGQYDACKQASLDEGRIVMGRYCVAMLRLRSWPAQEPGIPKTRLKQGICIPETCDTLSFEAQRDQLEFLVKFDLNERLRDQLVLESMYCLPDERSPVRKLPTGGWIYIGILSGWLVMVAIASIAHSATRAHEGRGLSLEQMPEQLGMLSNGKTSTSAWQAHAPPPPPAWLGLMKIISIQQSWAAFTSNPVAARRTVNVAGDKENESRVDLSSINIIKCLSVVAFISAHSCLLVFIYATSIDDNIKLHLSNTWFVGASFAKFVDVFFLLFGLLAAYNNLRKYGPAGLESVRTWCFINCYTLIRISVLYIVLYGYAKTLEPYTGEGPWWDYGTYRYSMRGNCLQEPWWRSIPYFSALGPRPRTSCQLAGWFVVSLSQISLAVPLIIYLLYQLPSHLYKCLLLALITIVSGLQMVIKMHGQTSIRGEAFGSYGGFLVTLFEQFEDTGTLTSLGRLSTVAYGSYVGYLLHLYEIRAISEWPSWVRSRLTLALTLVGHLLVLLTPLAGKIALGYSGHVTGVGDFLASHLTTMIAWPLLNGLLVLNMATTYKRTRLVRALGNPFWYTANKLVFGLYLVHWQVLMYLATGYPQDGPPAATWLGVFELTTLGFVISLALTLPLVILIDTPIRTLLSFLVSKIQARVQDERPAATEQQKVAGAEFKVDC